MERTIVTLDAFTVHGIAIRTNNEKASVEIGKLWEYFYAGGILQRIVGKIDETVIAVYYNYEKGDAGNYNIVLGCKVAPDSLLTTPMVAKHIQSDKYALFTAQGDDPGEVAHQTWEHVWNANIPRTFTNDFEIWKSTESGRMELELYIAIK